MKNTPHRKNKYGDNQHWHMKLTKICKFCECEFKTNKPDKVYCSIECYKNGKREEYGNKTN